MNEINIAVSATQQKDINQSLQQIVFMHGISTVIASLTKLAENIGLSVEIEKPETARAMPQPEIRDEAQWIAVHLPHSSVIAAAAYESLDGKAHIRFKQSRKVYEYNLPWYEFTRLVNAASAGSYYNRAIKGYFDAVEVTGESVLG